MIDWNINELKIAKGSIRLWVAGVSGQLREELGSAPGNGDKRKNQVQADQSKERFKQRCSILWSWHWSMIKGRLG